MEIVERLRGKFKLRRTSDSVLAQERGHAYGTFFGVFLPSALSIFGVIMYLRLGVILGKVGLPSTLAIICFSSFITLLAALSIASIATNMTVNKGGAYYIISRSLGIDFGSAIGIPLYFAQAIGIAFCIMGFSETIHMYYPALDSNIVNLITLGILGILSYVSTNIVMKTQLVIFTTIAAALLSLFLGDTIISPAESTVPFTHFRFWEAFAFFFPAVTGIEAGISMSGVLKNPSRSLPIGTLGAVLCGLVVYLALAIFLWTHCPRSALAENTMICQTIAKWKSLIILGIWGATLSSALGAIMSAPRTLQALAEDGIVFRFLGKEHGKNNEPRMAAVFTLALASIFLILGNIDLIAPILTMFFLISYGMLNLVAGLESLMRNPSWRPTFSVPPVLSLGGSFLCLIAMLMINAGATLVSLFVVFMIYFLRGRKLSSNWDDMCFGILMLFIKTTVYRLKSSDLAARSWRPHLLIFSSSVTPSPHLMEFTTKLTKGKSFLTFASILEPSSPYNIEAVKKSFNSLLKKNKVQAFVTIEQADHPLESYKRLILSHGIGPLTHNTVVLKNGDANGHEPEFYPEIIRFAYQTGKNCMVLKGEPPELPETKIDIWWNSAHRKTSELLLVLAHLYQSSLGIKKTAITIKSIVNSEIAREARLNHFVDFFSKSRLKVHYKVYVATEEDELKMMNYFSEEADLTFIGLPPPKEDQSGQEFQNHYHLYTKSMKNLKHIAYVVAAEPVNFQEIFR